MIVEKINNNENIITVFQNASLVNPTWPLPYVKIVIMDVVMRNINNDNGKVFCMKYVLSQ